MARLGIAGSGSSAGTDGVQVPRNIIEQMEELKHWPDDRLTQEMESPSGVAPSFLVLSELERRSGMRDRYQAQAVEQPQSTVAQDVIAAAQSVAPPPQAPPGMGPPGPPGMGPPPGPPGMGPPGMPPGGLGDAAPPMGMRNGGLVRGFFEGSRGRPVGGSYLVGDEYKKWLALKKQLGGPDLGVLRLFSAVPGNATEVDRLDRMRELVDMKLEEIGRREGSPAHGEPGTDAYKPASEPGMHLAFSPDAAFGTFDGLTSPSKMSGAETDALRISTGWNEDGTEREGDDALLARESVWAQRAREREVMPHRFDEDGSIVDFSDDDRRKLIADLERRNRTGSLVSTDAGRAAIAARAAAAKEAARAAAAKDLPGDETGDETGADSGAKAGADGRRRIKAAGQAVGKEDAERERLANQNAITTRVIAPLKAADGKAAGLDPRVRALDGSRYPTPPRGVKKRLIDEYQEMRGILSKDDPYADRIEKLIGGLEEPVTNRNMMKAAMAASLLAGPGEGERGGFGADIGRAIGAGLPFQREAQTADRENQASLLRTLTSERASQAERTNALLRTMEQRTGGIHHRGAVDEKSRLDWEAQKIGAEHWEREFGLSREKALLTEAAANADRALKYMISERNMAHEVGVVAGRIEADGRFKALDREQRKELAGDEERSRHARWMIEIAQEGVAGKLAMRDDYMNAQASGDRRLMQSMEDEIIKAEIDRLRRNFGFVSGNKLRADP